jgi:formylglycine-generating enzyme required for sulfatase activity
VTWINAKAFCEWLTKRERAARWLPPGFVYRLPSDHEWSCAVGIGEREDAAEAPSRKSRRVNNVFPWGTQWPPPAGAGNYAGEELLPALAAGKYGKMHVIAGYNDGFVNTSPVGAFPPNSLGLYDLGGNVFQWCADWCNEDRKNRVLRGASWRRFQRINLLSSGRLEGTPRSHYDDFGFRCVLGASSPQGSPD